jgi:hypothetical protein
MAHVHIETHPIGHMIHIEGTQEEVTTLLALAFLGNEPLKNAVLDALDAQDFLRERGVKTEPAGPMINIDNANTVN